jgi:uncharacterized protein
MTSPDFPYRFDSRNRTAMAAGDAQIRDLIEQLLFTTPGERVMRPDFGSGLLQLTFAPNGEELAAATKMLVQGALQEFLADRIKVHDVQIEAYDGTLKVAVDYTVTATQARRVERIDGAAR